MLRHSKLEDHQYHLPPSPIPPPARAESPFRLGDATDRTYQRYENQYSSNPLALNRFQLAEDKDKRRHMSHKFSLTQASEFEWSGPMFGR